MPHFFIRHHAKFCNPRTTFENTPLCAQVNRNIFVLNESMQRFWNPYKQNHWAAERILEDKLGYPLNIGLLLQGTSSTSSTMLAVRADDCITIDESLYQCRTKVSFKQNKNKPAKYDIVVKCLNSWSVRFPLVHRSD